MTRIIDPETGVVIPVTAIDVSGNVVLQRKRADVDGYEAVQVGFEAVKEKSVSKAEACHAKKYGSDPVRHIREFPVDASEELTPGQELGVDVFKNASFVDVTGVTKGRGFAGTVKRYGFAIGRMTHGNTNKRARGSVGAGSDPSRVFPGLKMAGQYGNQQKTTIGLELVSVDAEKNLIFVKGSVPGRKNGLLSIRKNVVKG
ncbi:50S ribosomal protein L3 [Chitinivibrio alkaliphilus ACht1]|uniref:50S ribosomal protein L3 n=2 Tax=Chitinivibrio TaxID=1505231 RepID=U7D443_9BACT|nr:50S ribosomal protein L3 [Chitinivibrio alkaliphilus ACht1]